MKAWEDNDSPTWVPVRCDIWGSQVESVSSSWNWKTGGDGWNGLHEWWNLSSLPGLAEHPENRVRIRKQATVRSLRQSWGWDWISCNCGQAWVPAQDGFWGSYVESISNYLLLTQGDSKKENGFILHKVWWSTQEREVYESTGSFKLSATGLRMRLC